MRIDLSRSLHLSRLPLGPDPLPLVDMRIVHVNSRPPICDPDHRQCASVSLAELGAHQHPAARGGCFFEQ